jgi:hypothetical protein
MGQNLLYNVEFVNSTCVTYGVKTTLFGPIVDMSDAEGCMFITSFGTEGGGFETSGVMHLQCATDAAFAGKANYGTTQAVYSSALANRADNFWVIDAYKPTFRYLRAALYHTTGDFQLVCMKYNMRKAGSTTYRDDVKQKLAINISSS